MAQGAYTHEKSDLGIVTVSCGVAAYCEHDKDWEDAVTRADLGLYRAKELGRNQAQAESPELDFAVAAMG